MTEAEKIFKEYVEHERALTHSGLQSKRGATEGPLKDLIPVFIDFETWMDKEHGIKLGSMTLRQYLAATHLTAVSIAVGYDEPDSYLIPNGYFLPEDEDILLVLEQLAWDPRYVFVAHNAAFDIRVLTLLVGTSWPCNVWCTMEGAMGAWPELPGGYGLDNIGNRLNFPKNTRKLTIDLSNCSEKELLIYNKRDVRVLQELYQRQIALLPAREVEVALRTHRQRQFYFEVSQEKLTVLLSTLEQQAEYAEKESQQYLTDPHDLGEIFNRDEGTLRSVRSQRLLTIINEKMGGDFTSTSLKKINPLKLAQHQRIAALLEQTSKANKMLSHFRRSKIFINCDQVDIELGYMRAHTGRFSSPSIGGRGLNLHNIPKHNKLIAKPIRSIFRLPEDKCFVRADLCNVEYRVNAKLCGCQTVFKMFDPALGGNIFNDPYCLAWLAMTAQKIEKKDPIRQVAKAAVLGLGFCMGPTGYARGSLLTAMAEKGTSVTPEVLHSIAQKLDWKMPKDEGVKRVMTALGCSQIVALCSYHIHKAFNAAHPEFAWTADWLVSVVSAIASTPTYDDACRTLDRAYNQSKAPDRNMIGLEIDKDVTFNRASVRVQCGPDWPITVCWRNPRTRPTSFGDAGPSDRKLTILKANGQFKPFTRQLAIENVVQAAARNGLCRAVAGLEKEGFPNVLHIHDEMLIITDKNPKAVLAAREAMIKVVGPKSTNPMGWAVLVNPAEINVSQSIWEVEEPERWIKIEKGDPDCLDNLT